EAELPRGDGKAFVNDRDHFVDLLFADHERRAKLDRHEGAGQKSALLHQFCDAATVRMARCSRSPTEGLLDLLVLDELDGTHQPEAAHIAHRWMGPQLFEQAEKVFPILGAALRQFLTL